jgi:dolichol kinase
MLSEVSWNILLMILCYGYVLLVIIVSVRLPETILVSQKTSRKFLHAMIGNLPFILPFFTSEIYPALVAAPFVLVTFLASPYSWFKNVKKLQGLTGITEKGHPLGLVFYALSYTLLAFIFGFKPYVVAAGILPMAYGDSAASLVGERYGKRVYNVSTRKSLEGSIAMFSCSCFSLMIGLAFFSILYHLPASEMVLWAIPVAIVATLVESISPKGFDNVTVPIFGALTLWLLIGGSLTVGFCSN